MDQYRISLGLDNKWKLALSTAFLICLGTYNKVFSLIAFAECVYAILFCSKENALFLMVFSMSFANIFKLSPSAQSLFTYLLLAYAFYQPFRGNNLSNDFSVAFVLLVEFLAFQFFLSVNILRTIKFAVNFLFIYYALRDGAGHEKDIFFGYIGGVISSSAVAKLGVLRNFRKYIVGKVVGMDSEYMNRFAGMYGDPNYYAVNVIIALCLAVLLYHRKQMKPWAFVAVSLSLFAFAIMTYSKSALLMLGIPVLMFMYLNGIRGRYAMQAVCIMGVVAFVIYALSGKIEFLSVVLARFQKAENINQLTTGRFGLWQGYLKSFSESFFRLLVGNGLGAKLVKKAAHNTYIDMIHYLGVIGTILVGRLLCVTAREFKRGVYPRNILNYSVMAVVMIMYFFLSELFYFDMPFHILLAIMVLNMKIDKGEFQKGVIV